MIAENKYTDYQTAPYKALCGCVAIISNRDIPNNIIQEMLHHTECERNVCSNCGVCGGTGILPEYQRSNIKVVGVDV